LNLDRVIHAEAASGEYRDVIDATVSVLIRREVESVPMVIPEMVAASVLTGEH